MKDVFTPARAREDIWARVFLRRGVVTSLSLKWAKFGDMLILDSPIVCWMGLINVAPCHSELAEPGQAQSSALPSILRPLQVYATASP